MFLTSFVSAGFLAEGAGFVGDLVQGVVDAGKPIFQPLLGEADTSDFLLAKILLLILLFVVINAIIKKTPLGEEDRVAGIISIVVSILAIRFMSESQLIKGILVPYGTLGVALTTILPFLIFFYFIYETEMGSSGRKLAWGFFGIVFLLLWASKSDQLNELANQIYAGGILLIILVFIFDKQIKKYFRKKDQSEIDEDRREHSEREVNREIHQLMTDYEKGLMNRRKYERTLKKLKKRREAIHKS